MKNPYIYRRQGWKDSTFEGTVADDGTLSLLNDDGKVIVSELPLIPDPAEVDPLELPKSYGTPANNKASAPAQLDEGKVDSVIAKINLAAESDPFTLKDLNRVNVPTLQGIIAQLNLPDVAEDATAKDLKAAIVAAAEAVSKGVEPADLTDVNPAEDGE